MKYISIFFLLLIMVLLQSNAFAQNTSSEIADVASNDFSASGNFELIKNISFNKRYSIYESINENYNWYFDKLDDTRNRKYGIVNVNGDVIFPTILERTQSSGNDILINIGNYYGLYNLSNLSWRIPLEYQSLSKGNTGYYIARKNGFSGLITSNNEKLLDFIWSSVNTISALDNYVIVCDNSNPQCYGIYSLIEKKLIIPCKYQNISEIYNQSYFKVKSNQGYNIIDMNNVTLFSKWYDEITIAEKSNLYIVKFENKFGVIDAKENIIMPLEYLELSSYSYSDGSYLAKNKDGKYGFITINGKVTLPFEYDNISNKYNDNYKSFKNGKCGLVRINSGVPQEIVTCEYDDITNKEKVVLTKKNGKYGLLDSYGKTILEPIFDEIDLLNFNSYYSSIPLIRVKQENSYFLLDQMGKNIDNQKYLDISLVISIERYNNLSYLKAKCDNGKYKIIDKLGKSVSKPEFDEIISCNENIFIVKNNGKYGLFSLLSQEMVVAFIYDNIVVLKDYYIGISGRKLEYFEINAGKVNIKKYVKNN